jgi:type IV pilus assembly protein PilE
MSSAPVLEMDWRSLLKFHMRFEKMNTQGETKRCRAVAGNGTKGFTLIEVMVTVAIVAILASVALPAYSDYIRRGQIQEAFGFLADYRTKMEQYYQDNRNYGNATACAPDITASKWNNFAPGEAKYFSFRCVPVTTAPETTPQRYVVTATGIGGRAIDHIYTINENGDRTTTEFKGATVAAPCWLSKSTSC